MGIQESVTSCFSKYVTFEGRARRSEYWWFAAFCTIVVVVLMGLSAMMDGSTIPMIVLGLFVLAVILPGLAVTVRRLHDTDRSGWWWFIQLVPAIGGIWFFVLMVIGGSPGPNRFGP